MPLLTMLMVEAGINGFVESECSKSSRPFRMMCRSWQEILSNEQLGRMKASKPKENSLEMDFCCLFGWMVPLACSSMQFYVPVLVCSEFNA